jgi:hypothetical protein
MLLLVGTFVISGAAGANARCIGDVPQQHPVGSFNFDTNSYFERYGRFHRYVSCVRNLDNINDLRVNWYIPGPHKAWIPAGETLKNARLFEASDSEYATPVEGCFEYGNVGETTIAQFWNPSSEQANSECGEVVKASAENTQEGGPLETIRQFFRIFMPSDQSDAHNTMFEVEGTIGLYVYSEDSYTFQFEYRAARYADRPKEDVSSVGVSLSFPGDALTAAFEEFYPDNGFQLSEKGFVKFDVSGSDRWLLGSAEITFTDASGEVVGVQVVPVYVPA